MLCLISNCNNRVMVWKSDLVWRFGTFSTVTPNRSQWVKLNPVQGGRCEETLKRCDRLKQQTSFWSDELNPDSCLPPRPELIISDHFQHPSSVLIYPSSFPLRNAVEECPLPTSRGTASSSATDWSPLRRSPVPLPLFLFLQCLQWDDYTPLLWSTMEQSITMREIRTNIYFLSYYAESK